jgi:hypothetical protein
MSSPASPQHLAVLRCLLRGLPLFFAAAPGTPLRVLAILALDTVHVLRTSRPMPRPRLRELALLLDFQACTNAAWDRKRLCPEERGRALRRLTDAGLGHHVAGYLDRLRALESRRPPIGGDRRSFDDARAYREAVVRLSLATLTAVALGTDSLEAAIRETHADPEVDVLFRMAVQCQVIDDVLDYPEDLAAGLPSYLTATASLTEALELTEGAARAYAAGRGALPLRLGLALLSGAARLLVRLGIRNSTLSPRTVSP